MRDGWGFMAASKAVLKPSSLYPIPFPQILASNTTWPPPGASCSPGMAYLRRVLCLWSPSDCHAELMKDNREEWFLKLNPLGKVPTIVCGDDVVSFRVAVESLWSSQGPASGPPASVERDQYSLHSLRCDAVLPATGRRGDR